MVKTKAEEALNLSLDDIIKRNRETVKPKAKSEGKDDKGGRKSRGAVRGRGKNGGDARIAVVKVVQTKRSAAGAGRRSVSGNFVDYDGSVHEDKEPAAGRPTFDNSQVRAALEGNAKWQHDKFDGPRGRALKGRIGESGFKLLISNLDHKVSDDDIKELFEGMGKVKRAGIIWDNSDRSTGKAEVVFEKKVDAIAAQKKYNQVALDGMAMEIELVAADTAAGGPRGAAVLTSGIRISKGPPAGGRERAPAPARRIVTEGRSRMYSEGGARGGGRGRGSAGGARGGGRRSATAQTTRGAKDLDAELADYMQE